MVCIYCSGATRVTNSRLQKRQNQTWRRRQCLQCRAIFTTQEIADLTTSLVVQYAKHAERPFSNHELFVSIYESCKHRPHAVADATALAQTVIAKLVQLQEEGAIARDHIAAVTYAVLERFDKAAATMYRAYHPA